MTAFATRGSREHQRHPVHRVRNAFSGNFASNGTSGNTVFLVVTANTSGSGYSTSAPTLGGSPVIGAVKLAEGLDPSGGISAASIWMLPNCPGGSSSVAVTVTSGTPNAYCGLAAYEARAQCSGSRSRAVRAQQPILRGRVVSSPRLPPRNPSPGPGFRPRVTPARFILPPWQPRAAGSAPASAPRSSTRTGGHSPTLRRGPPVPGCCSSSPARAGSHRTPAPLSGTRSSPRSTRVPLSAPRPPCPAAAPAAPSAPTRLRRGAGDPAHRGRTGS